MHKRSCQEVRENVRSVSRNNKYDINNANSQGMTNKRNSKYGTLVCDRLTNLKSRLRSRNGNNSNPSNHERNHLSSLGSVSYLRHTPKSKGSSNLVVFSKRIKR